MILNLATFIIIILFAAETISAQCGCASGAAVGGLSPAIGSSNIGVMRDGFLNTNVFYRYSYGDEYYAGASKTSAADVKKYETHFIGLFAAYGITRRLTLEAEFGVFPKKMQQVEEGENIGSGLSHLTLSAKYNFYSSITKEFEITAGLGGRAPLENPDDVLPQHVQPSTGAFGIIAHTFIHKGYRKKSLHLFLINRSEFNFENDIHYKYGHAFMTSFFATKDIVDNITAAVEIRNEFRLKDEYYGEIYDDSGGMLFVLSPQIMFAAGSFNFVAAFDMPIYKNYNGVQLTNKYSFAVNVSWATDLK